VTLTSFAMSWPRTPTGIATIFARAITIITRH